ncbi:MAG: 3-phosphoshikimate 1-carboxyvinyltransferase [Planctomycetota bacterium]|nr:3-phosphoshikimate 1-carboxyvinyltransferase [Planctomycetota bacterium]
MALEVLEGPFDLRLAPPGSKSLTNRALVLAALATGRSRLRGPLRSADTDGLRDALAALGAVVTERDGTWSVEGVGGRFPRGGTLDLRDGGTPTRFMLAAGALADAPVTVDGSPRMRERPVEEGIELLRRLGVSLAGTGRPEALPVRIEPWSPATGGRLEVGRTASSQFISALLLVAPWTREGITVVFREPPTSRTYVELTLQLLQRLGVACHRTGPDHLTVEPGAPAAFDLAIEPDASSAIYWWAAAAMVPGARMRIAIPRDSRQPDLEALALLARLGAIVDRDDDSITVTGPDRLEGTRLDAEACPDAAVMLAVACARAEGPSRIDGLHTLRVKETDRIHALAAELARTGCTVREHPDALEIDPATIVPGPIRVRTWNDHRIAMAFGILGLVREGVVIEDPGCVGKSYPGFWSDRARLVGG